MCNIAGYIGNKSAAPILIEMMKKQEGFGGGFYTGLSIHDGKRLQTVKVVGNLDNLLNETDAASFSGSVGFLHSRSNSGGNIAWGQPFTSNEGVIYVSVYCIPDCARVNCRRSYEQSNIYFSYRNRSIGS